MRHGACSSGFLSSNSIEAASLVMLPVSLVLGKTIEQSAYTSQFSFSRNGEFI